MFLDLYMSIWNMFRYFRTLFFFHKNVQNYPQWTRYQLKYLFVSPNHLRKDFFLPQLWALDVSTEHWWHSLYKFNLHTHLLVPFCSTAFSCPPNPTQMFHKPRLCSWRTGRGSRANPSPQQLKAQDLWKVGWEHQTYTPSRYISHTAYSSPP